MIKKTYQEALKRALPAASAMNTYLADNPELSGEEFNSSAYIINACRDAGMEVETEYGGLPTAFKATVCRPVNPQGRLALLCEYDALPDIGHGCGHSANGAMSFLTALAFLHCADEVTMDIDLIGTPDEELRGGKVDMANAGLFDDYDFAIMVHVSGTTTRPNSRFLALDDYRFIFHGQTAHAAEAPWKGINALNGVQLALHAIDMLRQHVRPETRIASYIVNGGRASNVVPDYAEIECCIRHTERAYLNEVVEKVFKCVEGAAIATGTTCEQKLYGNRFDDMKWNETGTDLLINVMNELGIPYENQEQVALGSSDVGSVSYRCPAFHPEIRLKGTAAACHTKELAAKMKEPTIDETLLEGASIMGYAFIELMNNPELAGQIKAEFKK